MILKFGGLFVHKPSFFPTTLWNVNLFHSEKLSIHSSKFNDFNSTFVTVKCASNFRNYSKVPVGDRPPRSRSLPRLMSFPEVLWPSALRTVKNWILVKFIIRPYFDRDFSIHEFMSGAKQALQVISSELAIGNITSLGKYVAKNVVEELEPVLHTMSIAQRQQLDMKKEDIYLSFPYQIGIMFDDNNGKTQKRWVEITMVFHTLRGLEEMRGRGVEIPWNMGIMPEYQDKLIICNYRFIKEFTQGKESDWTVNVINHFKPIDLISEA